MKDEKAKTFKRKIKKKNQQKDVNYKISATYIPNINNYFFNRNIYWYKENKANEQILKDISNAIVVVENDEENQKEEDKYKIDFGELKKKNEDVLLGLKLIILK